MLNKISWSARIVVRAEIETRSGGSFRTPCPHNNKPMFHEEMERKAIEEINKAQPYAVNKVVGIHIMRN